MFSQWILLCVCVSADTSVELLRQAREEIVSIRHELARVTEKLERCQRGLRICAPSAHVSTDRRNQDASSVEAMWSASGDCEQRDGCVSSLGFPSFKYEPASRCVISITPAWQGYLWVDYFSLGRYDQLYVDDVQVASEHQAGSLHGLVPMRSIEWSAGSFVDFDNGWRICQEETPLPPWTVTRSVGFCQVDLEGCLRISSSSVRAWWPDYGGSRCEISIASDWDGTVDIVPLDSVDFDDGTVHGPYIWTGYYYADDFYVSVAVQQDTYSARNMRDLASKGLQGLEARVWMEVRWDGYVPLEKLCPGPLANMSGPWGVVPWVCDILGNPCTTPCSQQFSDSEDGNNNGNLHDGHPRCTSSVGRSFCGPCRCGAGEAQSYDATRLYAHTEMLSFITCTPCVPGKFKPTNETDECELCSAGSSSEEGATACTACEAGRFSNEESLCLSCAAGFFGGHTQQSACEACASGEYAKEEGLTTCRACPLGSVLVSDTIGCRLCEPGTVSADPVSTACVSCAPGSYQSSSGMTQCSLCSDVFSLDGRDAHLWTTMEEDPAGQWWKEVSGASSVQRCGCVPGAWAEKGQCRSCGEGIQCHGMGDVVVQPGFFAGVEAPGFVWQCHGPGWRRCPGGAPGTCAERRDNTSIACGQCETFTRMTNAGPCEVCGGPDIGLLFGAAIAILVLLWCVYWVLAHENKAKRKEVCTLAAILCSQFLTMFQMLGALGNLSIQWPEPFATVVDLGSLVNFRLEVLNLGCVVSAPSLYRYVLTAFSFVVLIACMVTNHFLYILVFHFRKFRRGQVGGFASALWGALGTVFMAVFISVSSSIFQPFDCDLHPNGKSTVRAYDQVLCWSHGDSAEHEQMVIVGVAASLIPLGFLSLCLWATIALPKMLHQGDTAYLKMFAFLFFRFRPGAHFFVLVLLLRNLLFAVVPVIMEPPLDLLALSVVVIVCVIVNSTVFPWSVCQANFLDIGIHAGLLIIMILAALQTRDVEAAEIGYLLLVAFSLCVFCFVGGGVWCLHLLRLRLRKPFQFFLCHHKEGAGAFCRLVKTRLQRHPKVDRDVFLDSDNLEDLSLLFGIVRDRTDTLVVLGSQAILCRPWCVGEMTTARLQSLDTTLIIFPDFQWPSPDFVEKYATIVEGVHSLAAYGISLDMVQDTMRWLRELPQIVLPSALDMPSVDAVVSKLVSRRHGQEEMKPVENILSSVVCVEGAGNVNLHHVSSKARKKASQAAVVSIVDDTVQEALCAAFLLKEFLKEYFPLSEAGHVLGPDESLPETTTTLLVVCSNGCFQRPSFVRQLFEAEARGIGAVPIIIENNFKFPCEAMYRELRLLSKHILQGTKRNIEELVTVIGSLFEEIGISWRCQDSQGVLEVRAAAVAKRLGVARKGLTRMLTKKYDSDESSDESIEVHIAEFDASPRIRL